MFGFKKFVALYLCILGFLACFEMISALLVLILTEEQIPSITSNAVHFRVHVAFHSLLRLF